MEVSKNRNQTVDILRGMAMLFVVLQHTMTGCTTNAEDSFLFNVVWTLQIPLFILISGYVTRYSQSIKSGKMFFGFCWKRTKAYLLPWVVWSIVVRGIIFQQSSFLNIKYLIYHMDRGYWFLFTLWTITIIFGFSQFVSEKVSEKKSSCFKIGIVVATYLIGMLALILVGNIMGISFLCIKLTLYYMPFFFIGYLYGQIKPVLIQQKHSKAIQEIVVAIALLIWVGLLNRFNFFTIGESVQGIVIRFVASLLGCVAVSGLLTQIFGRIDRPNKIRGGVCFCRR